MSPTLSFYVARRFLAICAATFLGVLSLVVIVNLVELMRANSDGTAGFSDLIWMSVLKAPSVTISAAPFTVLLASMTCFAWLARSSELVVTRAAGVSIWGLLVPALITSSLLGIFAFTAYNPVASAFAERFEALEERYFGRSSSSLSVSEDGLWLRQGDDTGQTVIRAERASSTVEQLWDVSVFMFDTDDRFYRRLEADRAVLENRAWLLRGVRRWDLPDETADPAANAGLGDGTTAARTDRMRIPTDLTAERIQESFAAPETISFWALPDFISVLEESGFSSSRHRLHWHTLLSAPVVFFAMVLIGAAFSTRHVRFGGLGLMALGCLMTGFGYFFLSDIANALGASGAVPVELAAWGPPASAVLFSLGLLLHFEDG